MSTDKSRASFVIPVKVADKFAFPKIARGIIP
jgi:hypothetical protein